MLAFIKNRKVILTAVIAGVLVLGLAGGVVIAKAIGGDHDSDRRAAKGMPWVGNATARVAAILGLEEQAVDDAVRQARREAANDAIRARLNKMVESGKLTQEEADAQYNWFQSRPYTPGFMDGFKRRGPGEHQFRRSRGDRDGDGSKFRGEHHRSRGMGSYGEGSGHDNDGSSGN